MPIPEEFGYHHDEETVTLAYIALNIWHISPNEAFDIPFTLIYDVIRRQNLQHAVDDSDETFPDPAPHEDYEEDIPDQSTRFSL